MGFIKTIGQDYWVEMSVFILSIVFVLLAILTNNFPLAFLPVVFFSGLLLCQNIKSIYYLFALVLPFSIEMYLPGGLGTDLPSEPIMWTLSGLGIVFLLARAKQIDLGFWKHSISILVLMHVVWIGVAGLLSSDHIFSLKFFVAKLWYIVPFYFLFGIMHGSPEFSRRFIKTLILSTSVAIIFIMIRHSLEGFSFKSINECVHPIFRNHVNYAVMLVALLPYLFWLRKGSVHKSAYAGLIVLFLVAIYFSYTRAAMGAVFIGIGIYFLVRWKYIGRAIVCTMVIAGLSIPYFMHNNKYMDYAPNYERTIAHYNFDNLIEATYKLEDISTMERLYRWMAGIEMIKEKPVFGFGPATFYSNYQKFTITAFETYVSNNPEKSGIHNYYLMTLVEQGIIGLFIFMAMLILVFVEGQKTFHKVKKEQEKSLILAVLCSIGIVATILTINDLMEVDKIGPIFFLGIAIIATTSTSYSNQYNE